MTRTWSQTTAAAGTTIGSVLLMVAVATVALLTVAAAGLINLRLAVAHEAQQHARNLAESAIATAIAELARTDFAFGQNSSAQVQVDLPGVVEASGLVSFSSAARHRSLSNISSSNAVPDGSGGTGVVPAYSVRLLGYGRCGVAESVVECIVAKPPFADALVSNGPVQARGVEVAGIRDGAVYTGGAVGGIPAEEKLSGNLCSNFGPGLALELLGPHSDVTGNLVACGGITVGPDCTVGGAVDQNAEARRIPLIQVGARIDTLRPNAILIATPPVSHLVLEKDWFSRYSGNLDVHGDVILDHSVLLVEGNLTVEGALRGAGAVLVSGDLTVKRGTDLAASSEVALAASGNVSLLATGRETNLLSGLVYSGHALTARRITVKGVMIAQGTEGAVIEEARAVGVAAQVTEYAAPFSCFSLWQDPNVTFSHKVGAQVAVRQRQENGQTVYDLIGHFVQDDAIYDSQNLDLSLWKSQPTYKTAQRLGVSLNQLRNLYFGIKIDGTAVFDSYMVIGQGGGWMPEIISYYTYVSSVLAKQDNGARFNINELLADNLSQVRVLLWRSLL